MTDRDTQFKVAADLLLRDLEEQAGITVSPKSAYDYTRPLLQKIIAQRLHDFASHVAREVEIEMLSHAAEMYDSPSREEIMDAIDDLAEWPQVERE